jgi:hypothetical protein
MQASHFDRLHSYQLDLNCLYRSAVLRSTTSGPRGGPRKGGWAVSSDLVVANDRSTGACYSRNAEGPGAHGAEWWSGALEDRRRVWARARSRAARLTPKAPVQACGALAETAAPRALPPASASWFLFNHHLRAGPELGNRANPPLRALARPWPGATTIRSPQVRQAQKFDRFLL